VQGLNPRSQHVEGVVGFGEVTAQLVQTLAHLLALGAPLPPHPSRAPTQGAGLQALHSEPDGGGTGTGSGDVGSLQQVSASGCTRR
jgi:hypothetical protein